MSGLDIFFVTFGLLLGLWVIYQIVRPLSPKEKQVQQLVNFDVEKEVREVNKRIDESLEKAVMESRERNKTLVPRKAKPATRTSRERVDVIDQLQIAADFNDDIPAPTRYARDDDSSWTSYDSGSSRRDTDSSWGSYSSGGSSSSSYDSGSSSSSCSSSSCD